MIVAQLAANIDATPQRHDPARLSSRPAYAGYITIRCAVSGCGCSREIAVQIFAGNDASEVVERPYETKCAGCGHVPSGHATVGIVRRDPIERGLTSRQAPA